MDNGIIILIGERGTGKTSAAEKMQQNNRNSFIKAIGTTTRNKRPDEVDGIDYFFLTKEEIADDITAYVELNEFNDNYYGTRLSEIKRSDGKTPIVIVEPKGAAEIIAHCKKNGDVPFVVYMRHKYHDEKKLSNIRNENEQDARKRVEADSDMDAQIKDLGILPALIVNKASDYIDHILIREYKNFMAVATFSPEVKAMREDLKTRIGDLKAYEEMNSSLNASEIKKRNHIYGIAAAAMAVGVVAGAWPALTVAGILYAASKARDEHLEKNWFLSAEKFSTSDSLLFTIFSGLSPEINHGTIKTKKDLEKAIKNFKAISSENKSSAGIIEKSISAIENMVQEATIKLDGMQSIKTEYTNSVKREAERAIPLSETFVGSTLSPLSAREYNRKGVGLDVFVPPAETEDIYSQNKINIRV